MVLNFMVGRKNMCPTQPNLQEKFYAYSSEANISKLHVDLKLSCMSWHIIGLKYFNFFPDRSMQH